MSVDFNNVRESPQRDHNATYQRKQMERTLKEQADPGARTLTQSNVLLPGTSNE